MVKNKEAKIGIIGYNEGNGHPYSFSAIINGYNVDEMRSCEYPVIFNYLEKRSKSEIGIEGLKVTHIWTPNLERSHKIAACCYIDNVLSDYRDMINYVDSVIIARDDAESHREIADFFLKNEIKVLIDKPLCKSISDLVFFQPYLAAGLIFSTSGFRYHPLVTRLKELNESIFIFNTFNDWYKYGIHILEGAYAINKSRITSVQNFSDSDNDFVVFECENNSKIVINRNESNVTFNGLLLNSNIQIVYNDNFVYFKSLLIDYRSFLLTGSYSFHYSETLNLMEALIKAQESKSSKSKLLINEFK